jgi:hypothetical protein
MPFIMTQLMFEHEYSALVSSNARPPPRPCVLCCRYQMGQLIPHIRALVRLRSMDAEPVFELDETKCIQFFREKKDTEEGYLDGYMLKPGNTGRWEGFVDPCLNYNWSCLVAKQDAATGRKYIDQSLLKFRPEIKETPRIGERASNF